MAIFATTIPVSAFDSLRRVVPVPRLNRDTLKMPIPSLPLLVRLTTPVSETKKVSKKGGVGGPVALASGYENTYPLPNRPE